MFMPIKFNTTIILVPNELTRDFDKTIIEINKGNIKKNNIRFFLGYSGWEINQLEDEIEFFLTL